MTTPRLTRDMARQFLHDDTPPEGLMEAMEALAYGEHVAVPVALLPELCGAMRRKCANAIHSHPSKIAREFAEHLSSRISDPTPEECLRVLGIDRPEES